MNKEELTREEMIDALVEYHIDDITNGSIVESEFLSDVLRGDGWVPYNQLTDEEIKAQYQELIGDYEE